MYELKLKDNLQNLLPLHQELERTSKTKTEYVLPLSWTRTALMQTFASLGNLALDMEAHVLCIFRVHETHTDLPEIHIRN